MIKRIYIVLLMLVPMVAMAEQTPSDVSSGQPFRASLHPSRGEKGENEKVNRHEIRIGIGESFLGHIFRMGGEPARGIHDYYYYPCHQNGMAVEEVHSILQQTYAQTDKDVAWAPHVFGEYMYRVNSWLGVGVQTDFYTRSHREQYFNYYGDYRGEAYVSELCWAIMPVVRFTYLRREYVSLYSHIGIGYGGNFYMRNQKLESSEHLPAFGATLLGVSVGKAHWFGTLELGTFNTPANFMFMERMFSLSVGYRF